jgi:hypothetical protein
MVLSLLCSIWVTARHIVRDVYGFACMYNTMQNFNLDYTYCDNTICSRPVRHGLVQLIVPILHASGNSSSSIIGMAVSLMETKFTPVATPVPGFAFTVMWQRLKISCDLGHCARLCNFHIQCPILLSPCCNWLLNAWTNGIVTWRGDNRRFWIGDWIYSTLIHTQFVITSNFSAIANIHTLQINTAHAKFFPAGCVFTSRFLATASNSGDSSASGLTPLLAGSQPSTNYSPAHIALPITPRHCSRTK